MTDKKKNTTNKNKQGTKTRNTQPRTAKRRNPNNKTRRKKRSHRKKTSVKVKRLIALISLIVAIFVVVFIGKKTVNFVSGIWPNIVSIKESMTGGKVDKSNVNTDEQYDIEDEQQATLEKRHNVFIDVGCGGYENGYVTDNNLKEKELNLKIAKQVAKQLSKYDDINVILSRKEDIYMSPDERKDLAESENAEIFVSIHMASEKTGEASGVETIYHSNSKDGSSDFASLMQTSIMAFIKAENRGTNPYDINVLKDNTMPSIYIQCGFLSNSSEEKNLKDTKYQDELSKGIAQGILSYIDAKK